MGSSKSTTRRDTHYQLSELVRKQNTIINSLRNYAQELEDLCKSTHFQLSSLLIKRHYNESPPTIQLDGLFNEIKNVLYTSKLTWKKECYGLEAENK